MRTLIILLRILCYVALAVMLFGALCLFGPLLLGLCEDTSGGTVKCTDPTYRWFFETGFMIVMMGIFTGLPSLLALGGLVFSLVDLRRWLGR